MAGPDQNKPEQAPHGVPAASADAGAGDELQAAAVAGPPRRKSFHEAAHKLPQRGPNRWEAEDHDSEDESAANDETQTDVVAHASRAVLALGALGVVYGDIGTSPLYA